MLGTSEGIVRAARALGRELAPLASRAAAELAGAYEREVWPGGARAVVTWLGLLERNLARLDEQTDGLVERDLREAQARGAASDSPSVRAETALRVQLNHPLQEEIRKAISHLRAMASMFAATELHETLEVHLARTRALVARRGVGKPAGRARPGSAGGSSAGGRGSTVGDRGLATGDSDIAQDARDREARDDPTHSGETVIRESSPWKRHLVRRAERLERRKTRRRVREASLAAVAQDVSLGAYWSPPRSAPQRLPRGASRWMNWLELDRVCHLDARTASWRMRDGTAGSRHRGDAGVLLDRNRGAQGAAVSRPRRAARARASSWDVACYCGRGCERPAPSACPRA